MLNNLEKHSRPKIFLLGDSITQFSTAIKTYGWATYLSEWYEGRRVDIINRGFSGYNSRWILQLLPNIATKDLIRESIFATVFLGANDSVNQEAPQHISLDDYRSNINSIISFLKNLNDELVIILITPPPVDHSRWTTRHNSQVCLYADVIRELGSSLNLDVVDLWNCNTEILLEDLDDGLHLGKVGNEKVFFGIKEIILNKYNHLSPIDEFGFKNIPLHFPHWFDFDKYLIL